jgi:hypothetical protein
MARKNINSVGRPFVATPVLALGVSNLNDYQSGQWVRFAGQKSPVRLVRERGTGRTFLLSRPKGSRLSIAALRLSVGVANPDVLTEVK